MTKTKISRCLTIFACAAWTTSIAMAGPPYVTDDPEPTPHRGWEIYSFADGTGFTHSVEGDGGLDINYGIAKDVQASAVVGASYERPHGQALHAGLSDTELGVKYRFVHQRAGSAAPDVAIFPKLVLPTAEHHRGLGKVGYELPLLAQKDFGPWSLFADLSYHINPGKGHRNADFEGVAVTRQLNDRLTLGTELYRQGADSTDGRSSVALGLGGSWEIAEHWAIIGSGGPILSHRQSEGKFAFYLALAFHG